MYATDRVTPATSSIVSPHTIGPASHVTSTSTFLVVHVGVYNHPVLMYSDAATTRVERL